MNVGAGWDLTSFFLLVVVVEHVMILLKMLVEQLINDTPAAVIRGERERRRLIQRFKDEIDDCDYTIDDALSDHKPASTMAGNSLFEDRKTSIEVKVGGGSILDKSYKKAFLPSPHFKDETELSEERTEALEFTKKLKEQRRQRVETLS